MYTNKYFRKKCDKHTKVFSLNYNSKCKLKIMTKLAQVKKKVVPKADKGIKNGTVLYFSLFLERKIVIFTKRLKLIIAFLYRDILKF